MHIYLTGVIKNDNFDVILKIYIFKMCIIINSFNLEIYKYKLYISIK